VPSCGGVGVRLRRALWGRGLFVLALALFLVAPAQGAVLPRTPNPLPGSSFQGADGEHDDAPPRVDWQSYEAAGRVRHAPDPNAQDSAFTGGSKENVPGNWELTTAAGGVTPDKANILDAWTAADLDGPAIFGYLGFARAGAGGGTAFLTFELNHDSRLWFNGKANIPCRRTGDILLSYEPQGNAVEVVLQKWVTDATDLATGCATRGHLDDRSGLTPNIDAQGAVNAAEITNRLPGSYGETMPIERFGESALNLSSVLADAVGDKCFSFGSVWMHSRSSTAESSNMHDYVAPRAIALRSCAASGTKFHDVNGNGRRDPGEPGLARWLIWADYDDDGIFEANEPFGITDEQGNYVVNDIRPPDGTYMLRETLLARAARRRAAAAGVFCSFPNATTPGGTGSAPGQFRCAWGPISTGTTTYARGKDFGNFQPARLTVRKELYPSNDPGRFDLLVNGVSVVAAAGDGASRTLTLRPGTYTVSEAAAAGTNAANYTSTVDCKFGTARTRRRAGGVYSSLQLNSGQAATCTFRNVRNGTPRIAIDKSGPATATAGDTLRYTLQVTNPGQLPFPAASVSVTDPNCDDPPELVSKADASGGDDSPGTLDPGDTWTYSCSRRTSAPAECVPSVVPNTATVTGTTGGTTVTDSSSISTQLKCPPPPTPQPTPPPPGPPPPPAPPPPPPSPIEPPGPVSPDADDAGAAGVLFRRAAAGCIRGRVPRVNFAGTRVASVRVFVNGRLERRLNFRSLQARLTPRVIRGPGTHRLRVQVAFQRGTGSPPVTLRTTIRICGPPRAAARPSFTG
jgi:hypothetical protein